MNFIYPKISIKQTRTSIEFRTKLVKEDNGKFYYWNHIRSYKVNNVEDKLKFLNDFHSDVYYSIIIGKVDTNLMLHDGTPLFELAEEQITEEQRVVSLLTDGIK